MRVVKLTPAVEARLLRGRSRRDQRAERVAARIIADVRRRGDRAVREWNRRFAPESPHALMVRPEELKKAFQQADRAFLGAVRRAAGNVRRVASKQLPSQWWVSVEPGVRVGQLVRPVHSVGCYVPGGRHPLVSTLIMTAVPALTAGVRRIAIACPDAGNDVLAAAAALGLTEVWRMGGAQAVAALAYGTGSVRPVDRIVGPGSRWFSAAKRLVSPDCAVDLPAGPTEAMVVAERGNARFMAADLVAQAEHDPDATPLLVTPSRRLALAVAREVNLQLGLLPVESSAAAAMSVNGMALLAPSMSHALEFANRYAPEHLSLPGVTKLLPGMVRAAGAVFLGPWSAQALGDYVTGANHTLPTGGAARVHSGLGAWDFVRRISVQRVTRAALGRLSPAATLLARAEGLPGHARSLEVRRG